MRTATWTLVALAVLAAACAEQRPAVNRVQPNVLEKKHFAPDKEFYMRTTVVDAPAGAADGLFTAADSQPTVRVRFEITEKMLLARLTYELVKDTDHHGAKRTNNGQLVAAYPIESHFDIQHEYNSVTGEQVNVVSENTSDKHWYQRKYMRVDWSRNQITDAYMLDTLSQIGMFYGVKFDPVAYYVNDPAHPDAPVMDLEHGYFDVTNKVLATPQMISDPDWGDFPACFLVGAWPMINCNASEITLRQSFREVVDSDYEPLDYDGAQMEMFGYFTNDRFGYDRRYGLVDDKWHRFASRWNLWERSHVAGVACGVATPAGKDVHRDEDKDGTEDECASVGRGSRCDEFRGECTIPFRDRSVRTIPWHVNPGFPEDLFASSAQALDGWNQAMRTSVVAARLAECRRTGAGGCETEMGWPARWSDDYVPPVGKSSLAEVPNIFVLCHNPVDPAKGDDPACGPAGTAPRLGDLRYNFLSIHTTVQENSPWGIMVDAEDPLTGEKIAGSANQWSWVLDVAAANLVDVLALLNGEIPPDQFVSGQNVSDWVQANREGGEGEHHRAMPPEELKRRLEAFDPKALAGYTAALPKVRKDAHPRLVERERARALAAHRKGPGNEALLARMTKLRGSELERAMISPELLQLAGQDPRAPATAEMVKRASPFGLLNPEMRRKLQRQALVGHAKRHSCRVEEPAPDHLLGLAKMAQKLFPPPDRTDPAAVSEHRRKVWNWARDHMNRSVLSHELGHAMGLRHNFAGTFDALNFHPQYWQLRTKNGEVNAPCPQGTTDGSACVGPRWADPLDRDEIEHNINQYASSSVMDYPGDQNVDMMLEGKYDRAAVRFGYAGVVDVWDGEGLTVGSSGNSKQKAWRLTSFTSSPGLFGVFYFPKPAGGYDFIHYSQYQRYFKLIDGCEASDAPGAVLGKVCKQHPLDVVDYRDMKDWASEPAYAQFSWGVQPRAVDGRGRVRHGYMFSSDEYADSGNVPSFRFDAGADAYEQVRFFESSYENRYIFDSFRRNRVRFNSWDTADRIMYRYLDKVQAIAKTFAFGAVLWSDPNEPAAELLQDGRLGPLAMSATVALDMFARILTRPEPGYYCEPDGEYCPNFAPPGVNEKVYGTDTAPLPEYFPYPFRVALGQGRYIHNEYDYAKGYWWSDYQTQVGSYYEKIYATYYLAEAFDNFISNSKEDFTDGRYKNLSFATIFPDQIRRLYSGLFTGDSTAYAPYVVPPAQAGRGVPAVKVHYPNWSAKTDALPLPAGARRIDPNWAWEEQLYAMVFGAIFFPTNWSNDWINEARITVKASDGIDWPEAETYAFYNPASGMTYRAHSTGTETVLGKERQKTVGARMLEWANHLVTVAYKVERNGDGTPKTDAFGTPRLVRGADGRAQLNPDAPGADTVLQKFVANIDLLRELTSEYVRMW